MRPSRHSEKALSWPWGWNGPEQLQAETVQMTSFLLTPQHGGGRFHVRETDALRRERGCRRTVRVAPAERSDLGVLGRTAEGGVTPHSSSCLNSPFLGQRPSLPEPPRPEPRPEGEAGVAKRSWLERRTPFMYLCGAVCAHGESCRSSDLGAVPARGSPLYFPGLAEIVSLGRFCR